MSEELWGRSGFQSGDEILPPPYDTQPAFERDDMLWRIFAALAMVGFAAVVAALLR